MSKKAAPIVTGLSPKEGPPGTRITIRGENLGNDSRDLTGLTICGLDCLMSAVWHSSNKIVVRSGQAKGNGEIIVSTKSGGTGSCTVQFRGFNIRIGPLQDSAIWVDETETNESMRLDNNCSASPIAVMQENEDPLGISDESNDKKVSEEELLELFPEGSGNASLENFEAAWFLLENHKGTSFEDLTAGLAHLKHTLLLQNERPLTFAKTNLITFFDCYETLSEMNSKILADFKENHGISCTKPLEETLNKANKSAESIFHDVLVCKDKADATRNALGVLNRFKLFFSLPGAIKKNIEKGDYDLVITDYSRAKAIYCTTNIKVFKQVFLEIEKQIFDFKEKMRVKMLTMPTSVEEQKKIIRHLIQLESTGDPAWECIVNNHRWIKKLMVRCRTEQLQKEYDEDVELIATGPLLFNGINDQPNKFSSNRLPSKIIFVELFSKIISDFLLDFLHLGQAYGKLQREAKSQGRQDASKQNQLREMAEDLVILYGNSIRSAFLPQTLLVSNDKPQENYGIWSSKCIILSYPWLPSTIRQIRGTLNLISTLDIQSGCIDFLYKLLHELRVYTMQVLLIQAIQDVKNLEKKETWAIEFDDRNGAITSLPHMFEGIVNEVAIQLNEIVVPRQNENSLFDLPEEKSKVDTKFIELLSCFSNVLFNLSQSFMPKQTRQRRRQLLESSYKLKLDAELSKERRLIVVMSNSNLVLTQILNRIGINLHKNGFPDLSKLIEPIKKSYSSIETQLFREYIEIKSGIICGQIEQNMYIGRYDWSEVMAVYEVRSYIKEIVLCLLAVHAEVNSIGCLYLDRVMEEMVENVAVELNRLFHCVNKFNKLGSLQARVDLTAFDTSIGQYKNKKSQLLLQEAFDCIPMLDKCEQDLKMERVSNYEKFMKFHLMCLKPVKIQSL